ncbi:MAG: hypothetical protein K0B37_17315 [Bacteroidales bacterium]|nr:hypothetical protein [Bacteroidales bacterium]
MLELVEAWRESDSTQIDFANKHNISISKFRYWVNKSRQPDNENDTAGFLQLSNPNFPIGSSVNEIRLHYPNGTWLSLPAGTPVAVLKTLVDL